MTFTVSDIVPSTKASASIRLPDYTSGKVLRWTCYVKCKCDTNLSLAPQI